MEANKFAEQQRELAVMHYIVTVLVIEEYLELEVQVRIINKMISTAADEYLSARKRNDVSTANALEKVGVKMLDQLKELVVEQELVAMYQSLA